MEPIERFDEILDSIENNECSVAQGVIMLREALVALEDETKANKKKTQEIEVLTANLNLAGFVHAQYHASLSRAEDKENAAPPAPSPPKPPKQEAPKPKEKKGYQCPVIEFIDVETFEQVNRHQKGSLKHGQLKIATAEINAILEKKYATVNKFKGKSKLVRKNVDMCRYVLDEQDQSGYAFAFSEDDLVGASFFKLKHKRDAILRTLKSEGRIMEKRRAKKSTLYCLTSPLTKHIPS